MSMEKEEQQYLDMVLLKVQAKLTQMNEKMENNAKDLETMHDYFWENYTEFDEYGYEMYDNKQALKVGMTQQEEYSKERKRYRRMLDAPYFGRVDFCYEGDEEPEVYYIGIGSLSEGAASVPIVFDWRAPVSGLFYDYDQGPGQFEAPAGLMTGTVTRKRQYKIRHGKLVFALENEINIDDEILQQTLAEHADAKLKSIVTTIQREQNSIIRDVSHRILAVQGCAGSGKTSVALHRIAYLLYHNRDKLSSSQVMVLSPNSIFGDYISRILPELGEENVCEMTLDDFAYRELRSFGEAEDRYDEIERKLQNEQREESAYKQSKAYVEELNEFILELEWEIVDLKDFTRGKMFLSEREISKLFYEKFCDVPIFARLERVGEYVIDAEETLRDRNMEEEERQLILDQFNEMYRTTNTLKLYQQFLEDSGRDPISRVGGVIPYEDVYPLLYLHYATHEPEKRREVKHLVIDEMQDYSYLQYLIIQQLFKCPMTILGDKAQTMAEKQQDVLGFLPKIFGKEIHCVTLDKSYRSTREIMEYAASLAGIQEAEGVERHGEKPDVQEFPEERLMYQAIATQMGQLEDLSTMAVLCLDAESGKDAYEKLKAVLPENQQENLYHLTKDSMKFEPGISVMPFYLAKGLEFDAVFVPHLEQYETPLHRQALYINATRALHVLKLFSV